MKNSVLWDIMPCIPLFRSNISPTSSGSKNKLSKKPEWKQVESKALFISCSAYYSALKIEATCSSEISADIPLTTRYIPEDRTLPMIVGKTRSEVRYRLNDTDTRKQRNLRKACGPRATRATLFTFLWTPKSTLQLSSVESWSACGIRHFQFQVKFLYRSPQCPLVICYAKKNGLPSRMYTIKRLCRKQNPSLRFRDTADVSFRFCMLLQAKRIKLKHMK
jgi:hypothetical protein